MGKIVYFYLIIRTLWTRGSRKTQNSFTWKITCSCIPFRMLIMYNLWKAPQSLPVLVICISYWMIRQLCQLWSGFGPPGTSLFETSYLLLVTSLLDCGAWWESFSRTIVLHWSPALLTASFLQAVWWLGAKPRRRMSSSKQTKGIRLTLMVWKWRLWLKPVRSRTPRMGWWEMEARNKC